MTFSARAQNARILASGYIDPSPEGTNQTYYSPNFSQSPLAIAEAITPDIQNLAQGLQNDPTRIFNYVHDHIRHVFYFGSTKGAELTLLEQSGNDFDQCALLVSLLQAAGYTNTGYTFGWSEIPYDASNHMDLHHWLALGMTNTPGSWTGIVHYFGYLLGSRGFCQFHDMGNSNVLAIEHVWVNLTIGGTNYYLDPAFKISEPIAGINLSNAIQLNTNTLMANAGGYDYGWYVQGLNESLIRSGNVRLVCLNVKVAIKARQLSKRGL